MDGARYDGLAGDYEAFMGERSRYDRRAADALCRLLGTGHPKTLALAWSKPAAAGVRR